MAAESMIARVAPVPPRLPMVEDNANDAELPHARLAEVTRDGAMVCNFRDLTSVTELEERFRATFEHAAVGLAHVDTDGRILLANQRLCGILGYERSELVGLTFRDISHPEDRELSAELRARLHAGGISQFSLRKRYLRKDGVPVWAQITVALVRGAGGGPQYEVTAFEDISETVRAETELADSERRFRALIENSADGIVLLGADGRIRYGSPATTRILGYDRNETLGWACKDLVHPEDLGAFQRDFDDLLRAPGGSIAARARLRHKDGGYRLLEGTWTNLLADASVGALVANFRDVTYEDRSRQALAEAEARYRNLTESSPDAILVHAFGEVLYVNPACLKLLGFARAQEIVGRSIHDIADPRDHDRLRARLAQLAAGVHQPIAELRLVRQDGITVYLDAAASPVQYDGRAAVQVVARDATERRQREQELRAARTRSERLSRMYSALSETNEAIFRNADESELFGKVCELAVEYGGLKLAAVRLLQADSHWVVPVAHAGEPACYLERGPVSTDPGVPEGRGLAAQAILEGHSTVSNNFVVDPALAPWSEAATEAGIAGVASIPLRRGGRVIGLLSLYAGEPNWFDPELMGLVERMAENVSFALDNLDREARRKRAEQALRDSEERFRNLSGLSSDWYWEQDAEFRFTHTSVDHSSPVYGDPMLPIGKARWELPLTPLTCTWEQHRETLQAHRTFRDFEYSYTDEGGKARYISASGYPVVDDAGSFTGYRGIAKEITERKHAEGRLRMHAQRQEAIAQFGQFAIGRHSAEELYTEAARALRCEGVDAVTLLEMFTERHEYLVRATQGEGPHISLGQTGPIAPDSVWPQILRENAPRIAGREHLASRPLDRPWRAWLRGMGSAVYAPVHDDEKPIAMLCIYAVREQAFGSEDVRFAEAVGHVLSTALQRQKAEERLARLAQFDALTGLPNRTLLQDRLAQTIVQSRRRQVHAGVLFVDLDRFKLINDTLGHHQGDALIRQVGQRLLACVRAGDTVGRISGDEFAVVLADMAHPDDAALVAQKALDALARPFDLGGNEAYVTASIGIAAFPDDGGDAETLLKNADMAMYRAKESARNSYCFFTAEMNRRSMAKVQLNTDLRHALERGEFALHYQPKVDLASGKLRGMEALMRWNHPVRGLVPPAEFIPALEDSGLIIPVGEWVVEEACRQVRRWQAAGCMPVPVAVNLSPKQFRRRDLDAVIGDALSRSGVSAEFLELEITESCLMENPEDAVRVMRNLRAAGLRISIDDFGTGYSSLSYLTRLPLSALKIDGSFVRDVDSSAESASIVRAIIDMAQNLRLTVIAEGVETEQQAAFLRRHGCDQAQGYFYGRPVAAEQIATRLARP